MDWRERTKSILAQRNLNQVDLAEKLGVTKAAVSIWLNHKRPLSKKNTDKLQRQISEVLEVSTDYLIYGDKEEPRGRSVPHLKSLDEISKWMLTGIASAQTEWSICLKACSDKTFSFQQVGSAMDASMQGLPTIPSNSIVFIDPDLPLDIGKACLFKSKAPVLGIYENSDDEPLLIFANPRFQTLKVVTDNYIGRVIGMAYFF